MKNDAINVELSDLKMKDTTYRNSSVSNINGRLNTISGTDTLIQLRSGMKLMTFCCFLMTFNLSIILSSVYFVIQINGALKVFNDIEENWSNNFILDISEKTTSSSECSEPLITYTFPGAASVKSLIFS